LDLVRGIWNIYFNHQIISRISSGGTPKPFNSILLGPLHTVHLPKGDLADPNRWWYDPDYTGPVELKDLEKNWNHLKKFERWVLKRSRNSSLEELIVDSIQRYTSALDEKKRHNAFLQLWGLFGIPHKNPNRKLRRYCETGFFLISGLLLDSGDFEPSAGETESFYSQRTIDG
jgi:hypothetical protein